MRWRSPALLSPLCVRGLDMLLSLEKAKERNCAWSVEIMRQGITTMLSHVRDVKVNFIIYCLVGISWDFLYLVGIFKFIHP